MIRIERMYVSPVKALGLCEVKGALLDKPGIAGDRAFFIIDGNGKLFTQREHGPLVRVTSSYDPARGTLTLLFPDGKSVHGVTEPGEAVATRFFGERSVEGCLIRGDWNDALSSFVGQPLRLVKAQRAGASFDGFPLSICSMASLDALATAAGQDQIDGRRFRQNIYISGATAHQEDDWLGREVRVGNARLRVKMRDSRCIVTTRSPQTGEPDLDTLKLIASYRTDQPKEVNFGMYCTVAEPGEAHVGDDVAVID